MSVFTTVTKEQLRTWIASYPLGDLLDLQGIASGITNTNYFVTTTSGRYVLTLFEKNSPDELPYFLDLMRHLAERGIPCPHPVAMQDGMMLGELNGKPAALVSCLKGRDIESPSPAQCAEVGRVLANMHIAGQSFKGEGKNARDNDWRLATANSVIGFLNAEDRAMLESELAFEASSNHDSLDTGVIHADLFKDNVLFDGDHIGGLIDFYYACEGAFLYDVAIAANDWCVKEDGSFDMARLQAMLEAYDAVRPFTEAEHAAWSSILRKAATRFWLSRLYDKYFPQEGELTHAKDPDHFRNILSLRIKDSQQMMAI